MTANITSENPAAVTCPHCGYTGALAGQRFCPNCGQSLPLVVVNTTEINVDQSVGEVHGGKVTGIDIDKIIGNVFIGSDDVNQALQRRNLRALLGKVKSFWVDGVLAGSVRGAMLIEIHKRPHSEIVERPLAKLAGDGAPHPPELPADSQIEVTFDTMDQALLILDGVGSGKTTTLLQLAQVAVTRAEKDPNLPIPVVLNLSTWASAQQSIADWAAGELALRYQIPRDMGRRWLDEQRLFLLLDGLDEVGPGQIRACVVAVNQFREAHGLVPICIATRAEDYCATDARLVLSGAVELQPLTVEQIDAYLAATGAEAATLRAVLQRDSDLEFTAQTPLMLSVMRLAFAELSAVDFGDKDYGTPEQRRVKIVERYVERSMAVGNAEAKPAFTQERSLDWLGWLARGMAASRQSSFLVEQLQSDWLASGWQVWTYWLGSRAVVGLIIGLVLAVTAQVAGTPYGRALYIFVSIVASTFMGVLDRQWVKRVNWPAAALPWVKWATRALAAGLLGGACFYVAFEIILLQGQDSWRLTGGMALVFGLVYGLQGLRPDELGDIHPVEALTWSWREAWRGRLAVLLIVLVIIAGVGAIFATTNPLRVWLPFGLVYGILAGLAILLIFGLRGRAVERQSYPNQGMWLSARNAMRAGLVLGLAGGLVYGVYYGLLAGLSVAMRVGVVAALCYGAFEIIKHIMLRALLAVTGQAPWNIVTFLEHAARLGFLQRVGGGYMFLNRVLQEYFANR